MLPATGSYVDAFTVIENVASTVGGASLGPASAGITMGSGSEPVLSSSPSGPLAVPTSGLPLASRSWT